MSCSLQLSLPTLACKYCKGGRASLRLQYHCLWGRGRLSEPIKNPLRLLIRGWGLINSLAADNLALPFGFLPKHLLNSIMKRAEHSSPPGHQLHWEHWRAPKRALKVRKHSPQRALAKSQKDYVYIESPRPATFKNCTDQPGRWWHTPAEGR